MTELHSIYSSLSREILLQMRGTRAQAELSTQLGYSFNQVGKWETGATLFHWDDFKNLCEVLKIPWRQHFQDIFLFHSNLRIESNSVVEILSQFFGHASISEMAHRMGKSRSSMSRLIHDEVKIDFADVLRMMDQRPFVMNSWLAKFLDLTKISSLQVQVEAESRLFQGLLVVPWAPIVNSALGLKDYHEAKEHSDSYLAIKTGLTEEQVRQALAQLLKSNLVEVRDGKFHGMVREMTFLRVPEFRKVTQFIGRMITDAFQTAAPGKPNVLNPSLSTSRMYPLSSSASQKVAAALVKFHHEVSDILKNDDEPKDHVRAILIHSLDLELISEFSKNGHP